MKRRIPITFGCFLLIFSAGCVTTPSGEAPPARLRALNEAPAEPRDWGYRPADGAEAEINPPPFTWRPERGAVGYLLEVAADPGFEAMVYAPGELPWSAHCPDEAFPSGEYYWRYATVNAKGARSAWSTVRGFALPEAAPRFPKPSPPALRERIPVGHPRLFFRPEHVPELQRLAQGGLSEAWQGLVDRADYLVANPPDSTEPPLYPEGIERGGGEWKKIWWGNRVYGMRAANAAATLAFAYRLGGDRRHGEAARELLLDICAWDPKGSTNFQYNDEAAMPLLYYPSRAYTWAWDIFTPEERQQVVDVMAVRGRDCFEKLRGRGHLWRPFESHANRAWHWLAEVALAFHEDIPEAEAWLDYALTIFYTCYPVWGGSDGGWHEGTGYWSSYLDRFMYWAQTSQAVLDIDPFEKPFFARTGDFGLYALPPGASSGGFGDHAGKMTSQKIAATTRSLALGARNPYWLWHAQQHGSGRRGYEAFIAQAFAGSLEGAAPKDLPTSRVFRPSGLAILNTNLLDGADNVQVHFKSSPYGRQSHGYNANNAFLLNLDGKRALLRSGYREMHGSPHHTQWMWETKSDNAILVNGEGQIVHSPEAVGRITQFSTSERLDVVAGEAGEAYEMLERWTRRILFFKPYCLLIHDVLEAPAPSTYQWLLHAKGAFEIRAQGAAWQGEAGEVEVQFMHPPELAITQTDAFKPPPHAWAKLDLGEWHLSAATSGAGVTQEFVTLIAFNGAVVDGALEGAPGNFTAALDLPEGRVKVRLAPDGFSVTGTGFYQIYRRQ